LNYLLDTNAVSDWLSPSPNEIAERIEQHLAAVATRFDAVIISRDTDFDILPITREDWTGN
jgi:predicted nucleic acid-binding protein